MRIGAHIGIEGGLPAACKRAIDSGCETLQIFAANPNAWKSKAIEQTSADLFRQLASENDIWPVVVHTQYLVNLASPDENNYAKSVAAVTDAMHRAEAIGAEYVVTHIGSHRGEGFDKSFGRICDAVQSVLADSNAVILLLENSSGSGNTVGSTIEEIAAIVNEIHFNTERIAVCLDTAHLWGAGYDVATEDGVNDLKDNFNQLIGLERLRLLHLNDSKAERGSKRDRHECIGKGTIGLDGFRVILNHPDLIDKACILETPYTDDAPYDDLAVLKSLRDSG